jgi:hypothetical protein
MDEPAIYRIVVVGQIDARLARWLGALELSDMWDADGEKLTVLTGLLRDQAALIGVLVQLYNRGHCLLGLERTICPPNEEGAHTGQ